MKSPYEIVQALQTLFGRTERQMGTLRGEQQNNQDRLNKLDNIENNLSQMFFGYADLKYDRMSKYRDFDRMDIQSTEAQVALDIYAEEASQKDEKTGLAVYVESEDPEISSKLNAMFSRIKLEAKAYGIYRNVAKYGDCFMFLLLGAYGVHGMQFIHPGRIERVQEDGLLGFKAQEISQWLALDNKSGLLKPWQFVHWRLIAYDQESVYGRSMLDPIRKVWKSMMMLETLLVLYRLTKSVQRNIFYVDVGQASVEETQGLVEQYQRFLKQKNHFIDPKTNDFKIDFNPATLLQDIVWPVRAGSLSKVDKLENTANIGPLEDLEHFRNKIRLGVNIPKEYFDGEQTAGWNSKESLIIQDIRFGRKIQKLQTSMQEGLTQLCQIHWAITEGQYLPTEAFVVRIGTTNDYSERIREDILLRKAQIMEILANIALTLGWNRRVWTDYLLDQVFPLPAELRSKLNTPDPIDLANVENEIRLNKEAGRQISRHVKQERPPKKATAENVTKGLRKFGEEQDTNLEILAEDLLGEYEEAFTALKEMEELQKGFNAIKNNSEVYGFSKYEMERLISEKGNIVGQLTTLDLNETEWKKRINWQVLNEELGTPKER